MAQTQTKEIKLDDFCGSFWFELGYSHALRGMGFPSLYEQRGCKQFRYEHGRLLAAVNPNLNMNNPSNYEKLDTIRAYQEARLMGDII